MQVNFELKSMSDMSFEGYASTFGNVDHGYDKVIKGAFAKSIKENPEVPILWYHNPQDPIGISYDMEEDDKGLFMKGKLVPGVQRAEEAMRHLKFGTVKKMSIGYSVVERNISKDGVRELHELKLFENSLVVFPMNDAATVTGVKDIESIRDLEYQLRGLGYSNKAAKLIASGGWNALKAVRDEHPDELRQEEEAKLASIVSMLQRTRL
jgi:HK97 family phage prohead protease